MKFSLINFLFVLLIGLWAWPLPAQLSNDATISILTCRAGDEVENIFGHTAIRVVDPATQKDEVYNYGTYDFNKPNFMWKFLRGELEYKLSGSTFSNFIRTYQYQKRSVFEQVLNLDRAQRNKIYNTIQENYKPENREYIYEFFFDNCSTRTRDLIEDNIVGADFPDVVTRQLTFREMLDQHNYIKPWIDFGMDLLVGTVADREATVAEQMFLPEFLFDNFERSSIVHEPLVSKTHLIANYEQEAKERERIPFFSPALFFGLLLLLELILLVKSVKGSKALRAYDNLWYFLVGIGSLVLIFMWFGTIHITTKGNLNVLWMNPLFLLLAFSKKSLLKKICLILLTISLFAAAFVQDYHIASVLIILILFMKLLRSILAAKALNQV